MRTAEAHPGKREAPRRRVSGGPSWVVDKECRVHCLVPLHLGAGVIGVGEISVVQEKFFRKFCRPMKIGLPALFGAREAGGLSVTAGRVGTQYTDQSATLAGAGWGSIQSRFVAALQPESYPLT